MTIKGTILVFFICTGIIPAGEVQDSLFWHAARNLDFAALDSLAYDDEHQGFARGLKSVVGGDLASTETVFKRLYRGAQDSLLRASSAQILGNIQLANSRWNELLQLGVEEQDEPGIDPLIEAYRMLPQERYVYPQSEEKLPVGISISGTPLVEVEINGHKRTFWLDTGAGLSAIASDVAAECGILPLSADSAQALTATTKKVAIQPAVIQEFKIGDLTIENHPAVIIASRDLEFRLLGVKFMKIDGIIGYNALKNMEIEIDYAKKTMVIRKPSIRIGNTRNLFWLGVPVAILASPDGTPLYFFLDTGSSHTSIYDNIFTKLSFERTYAKEKLVGSAGGIERFQLLRVPQLELVIDGQEHELSNITTLPRLEEGFVSLDGILGADVLRGKRVRIDPANGRLELSPNP